VATRELQQAVMLQRVLVVCAIALLALLVLGAIVALLDYVSYGEDYRFGTEVAGFSYRSAHHFVLAAVAQSVLGVGSIALLIPLVRRKATASIRDAAAALLMFGAFALPFTL